MHYQQLHWHRLLGRCDAVLTPHVVHRAQQHLRAVTVQPGDSAGARAWRRRREQVAERMAAMVETAIWNDIWFCAQRDVATDALMTPLNEMLVTMPAIQNAADRLEGLTDIARHTRALAERARAARYVTTPNRFYRVHNVLLVEMAQRFSLLGMESYRKMTAALGGCCVPTRTRRATLLEIRRELGWDAGHIDPVHASHARWLHAISVRLEADYLQALLATMPQDEITSSEHAQLQRAFAGADPTHRIDAALAVVPRHPWWTRIDPCRHADGHPGAAQHKSR